MNNIGKRIRDLRKKNDLTQEKLAGYLNVSYQAVSKWENGVNIPDLSLIVPLAKILHTMTDELLGHIQSPEENDVLREELEKIRKEKLTAEELKQLEDEEREKNLAEREALLKAAENKMYAVKAIKKAGLDDGSETALDILALVNGKDEATIDGNIKALKALVDKLVKAEVDKTFKDSGRNPQQGNGGAGGGDNPYAAGTFNLTKQCELEATNPELAAKLKAAAGVSK